MDLINLDFKNFRLYDYLDKGQWQEKKYNNSYNRLQLVYYWNSDNIIKEKGPKCPYHIWFVYKYLSFNILVHKKP